MVLGIRKTNTKFFSLYLNVDLFRQLLLCFKFVASNQNVYQLFLLLHLPVEYIRACVCVCVIYVSLKTISLTAKSTKSY